MTIDAEDVALLDRLAVHDGKSRSGMLRHFLRQSRPLLRDLVASLDALERKREELDAAMAKSTLSDLELIAPELEDLSRRTLGALSALEGRRTAARAADPRSCNTGVTPRWTPIQTTAKLSETDMFHDGLND